MPTIESELAGALSNTRAEWLVASTDAGLAVVTSMDYLRHDSIRMDVSVGNITQDDDRIAFELKAEYKFTPDIPDIVKPYVDDTDADAGGLKRGWTTMPYRGEGVWQDSYIVQLEHPVSDLETLAAFIWDQVDDMQSNHSIYQNATRIIWRLEYIHKQVSALPVDQRLQS